MTRRTPAKPSRLSPLVTACVLVAALYFAQEVLIPLVLAMLLSFLLAPAVRGLERRLGRALSVVVVACAFAVIGSLGWVVAEQVVDVADRMPQYQDEIVRKVRQVRGQGSALADKVARMGRAIEKASTDTQPATAPAGARLPRPPAPDGTVANPVYTVPLPSPRSPLSSLGQYLGLALGPLGTGALVIVFTIFMLVEREDLRDRMIRLVSGGHYMVTTRALDDAGRRITRYMIAQSIVNGTYGLAIALGLWLIGLVVGRGQAFPSFVLWGLLCAVLRFIPYIGPWVAAAFPVTLSLAVYPGFTVFTATACLFVLLEIVSNNLMEPWLYGASTGMSTVAVLVAAVFWTWLWGPVGLLLATPLTVCIVVVGKYVPRLRFLDVLLGDQPALPRHVTYYSGCWRATAPRRRGWWTSTPASTAPTKCPTRCWCRRCGWRGATGAAPACLPATRRRSWRRRRRRWNRWPARPPPQRPTRPVRSFWVVPRTTVRRNCWSRCWRR
jgi:predicted PurR-regulated permease PerM